MLTVVSLFPLYLLGLGFLLVPVSPKLFENQSSGPKRARLLALLMAFGLMANYLLTLILESLQVSLVAGVLLSLTGAALAVRCLGRGIFGLFGIGWIRWGIVLYITLLYLMPILFDPLSAGDARSIWFFHGKIIFFNDALNGSGGWADKAIEFSHVDYPKFVGIIAAQCATVAGFWNEFLPKASLLVLFFCAILGLLSFFERNWIDFSFLMALFVFSLGQLLWDGYMDGYLALYVGTSILFLGRWLDELDPNDLVAGALFLGVAGNLKNEGILLVFSILTALIILSLVVRRQNPHTGGRLSLQRWFLLPVALPVTAYILWMGKKLAWGLNNDLQLGTGSFAKISARISDGAFGLIGSFLMVHGFVGKAIVLFLIVLVVAKTVRVRLSGGCWLALLTACIYFSGIFLIYLATPADLGWHLQTSASRTMLPVLLMLFAAAFSLMRGVEASIWPHHISHQRGDQS